MQTLLIALAVLLALPGLMATAQIGLFALASLFYREARSSGERRLRMLVLIPAHNEELVIGRALEAINADRAPSDLVLVVADRCTDATAAIARQHGARVLERGEDEAPGRAAARQAGLDLARSFEWDAVVMLDADSIVERGFFAACDHALASGADAVQGRSESAPGRTLATEASLAAFTLQGITLPRGRARMGLSVRLRGTGMAIRRDVALAHRFTAPASEDLFFTLDLLLDGVRCRHVDWARLRSEGASNWGTFGGQKLRYEAGRMAAARSYAHRLLARGIRRADPSAVDMAWFLLSPPFAIAAASLLAGLGVAALAGVWTVVGVLVAAIAGLGGALVVGLVQARARARTWLALLVAPWYLAWKLAVQARALASVLRRDQYYGPTARAER